MRSGEPVRCRSANPLYYLSAQGKINVDFHIAQSSNPGVCQPVAALLLRVGLLHASAGVILPLP